MRKQSYLLALLCIALLFSLVHAAVPSALASYEDQPDTKAVWPYVYATPGSPTSYDVMLADGSGKDRRIASVKVDGVSFGDASARLSSDGSHVAVRVTGDRYGGSSLHLVEVKTGKSTQVAHTRNSAEGIGSYMWSPAGNTLAFVRSIPALDPARMDDAYGTIFIVSAGFDASRLQGSGTSDRPVGFSGDGLGVYTSRRESVVSQSLEHLVYLPLGAAEPVVLIRSRPELRYSSFAVYSPPGKPAKVAAIAEGTFLVTAPGAGAGPAGHPSPAAPAGPQVIPVETHGPPPPPDPTAARSLLRLAPADMVQLSRPRSMGLVVSDLAATWPSLVRQDGELYPYIAWNGSGDGLLMGGSRTGISWAMDMAGNKRPVDTSLFGVKAQSWSPDGSHAVLSDNPATRLVSLDYASGTVSSERQVGAFAAPGEPAVKLPVPYVHQVLDTSPYGDGNWACGPTSIVMALAYYGKIDPWSVYVAQQAVTGTTSLEIDSLFKNSSSADYAPYVTNEFTLNGRTYSSLAGDPRGNLLAGLYGTICPTGLADWQLMVSVLNSNGLGAQYVDLSWDGIVGALKRGHPVLLGNELTAAGHIVLVIGYTPDGNLIVNDPYGDRFVSGYGSNDGRGVFYPWKRATPRRALEVIGTYPPPTRTPYKPPTPGPTATIVEPTATLTSEPLTATPSTTATVTATETPEPTEEPTEEPPTSTPEPTDTPTPAPTDVPEEVPTEEVLPTPTPELELSPTPGG